MADNTRIKLYKSGTDPIEVFKKDSERLIQGGWSERPVFINTKKPIPLEIPKTDDKAE